MWIKQKKRGGKKMNKKILISVLLIVLLAFGAGLGTMAWFTSNVKSDDNVLVAGTLVLNDGESITVQQLGEVNLGNMQPGDEEQFQFAIKNNGSLDLKYRLRLTDISGGLTEGEYPLEISYDGENWEVINDDYSDDFILAAEAEDTHILHIRFPQLAGNEYQEATGQFTIIAEATQINAPWPSEEEPEEPQEPQEPEVIATELKLNQNPTSYTPGGPGSNGQFLATISGRLVREDTYSDGNVVVTNGSGRIRVTYRYYIQNPGPGPGGRWENGSIEFDITGEYNIPLPQRVQNNSVTVTLIN